MSTGSLDEFRQRQGDALAECGVAATSTFVEVQTPPLRVHVLEAGAGAPVLMIHGGNSVAVSWAPLMAALAPRFRVLAPDRPGCGLTTTFDYRGVDLRAHAVSFVEGVLGALGLERAHVVANSMGGFWAMAFAIAHPERVSKLVLLGEPAASSDRPSLFHRLVGTRGINALLYATALSPAKNAAGARAGLTRAKLLADPSRPSDALLASFAAAARVPGAVRSWTTMVEQVFAPHGWGLFAGKTLATNALVPELGKLTTPTLFLWGDKDPFGPPDVGRAFVEKMPHARLEVVADAGHLPWLDQPDFCARAVTSFLEA